MAIFTKFPLIQKAVALEVLIKFNLRVLNVLPTPSTLLINKCIEVKHGLPTLVEEGMERNEPPRKSTLELFAVTLCAPKLKQKYFIFMDYLAYLGCH